MRQMLMAAALAIVAAPAAAQVVEIGAGVSRACGGSDGSFCGGDAGAMWGTHASAWLDDRLEIGVRFSHLPLSDLDYFVPRDSRFDAIDDPAIRQLARVDLVSRNRSRQILGGEAIYHFSRGRPVRFLIGLGVGHITSRFERTCTPAGCERLLPILQEPAGAGSSDNVNVAIVAGVSGRIRKRLQLRGGVRLHNLGGEEVSTSELFTAIGYRFGGR